MTWETKESKMDTTPVVKGRDDSIKSTCSLCQLELPSKRKLFHHLIDVHDYVDDRVKPCKVVLLVGWISNESDDMEVFLTDPRNVASLREDMFVNGIVQDEIDGNGTTKARVETAVFNAIRQVFDAIPQPSNDETSKFTTMAHADLFLDKKRHTDEKSLHSSNINSSVKIQNMTDEELAIHTRQIYSKGLTRGSQSQESTLAVGIERTCHSLTDTFLLTLPRHPGNENNFILKVNNVLMNNYNNEICILSCKVLPGKGSDINGYSSCTQRRFEYMLPLDLILPDLNDENEYSNIATYLIEEREYKKKSDREWRGTDEQIKKSELEAEFPEDTIEGNKRVNFFRILKVVMKNMGGRYQMYYNFASGGVCPEDSSSNRTVDRMYHKAMSKNDGNTGTGDKTSWAIFSISGDNFLRGQIRRMFGVAIAISRGWLPEEFLDYAIRFSTAHRDALSLKAKEIRIAEKKILDEKKRQDNQKRFQEEISVKAVALAECDDDVNVSQVKEKGNSEEEDKGKGKKKLPKKEKPEKDQPWKNDKSHKCDLQLRCEPMIEVPSAPAFGLYLAECRYGNYEAKHESTSGFVLDPRRAKNNKIDKKIQKGNNNPVPPEEAIDGINRINEWEKIIHNHIMNNKNVDIARKNWVHDTKKLCSEIWDHVLRERPMLLRTDDELREQYNILFPPVTAPIPAPIPALVSSSPNSVIIVPPSVSNKDDKDTRVPVMYQKVLKLLQVADQSGAWPASSFARSKLLDESSSNEEIASDIKLAPSTGGTFTLGAFPEGQSQPKGNNTFPELLKAIFELETLILPNRPPSSTVAVNKHAQFKMHRDSGAGSGQSLSAIVALGDFVGGELGLDHIKNTSKDTICNVRYSPKEFCGWTQRHYTLPFVGERYSLVWFTPLGCSHKDMFWNHGDGGEEEKVGGQAKKARIV
jgi:tRNA U38,U39,U40 pseudouridine synthase TruA